jgi:hypothetical protein
MVRAFNRMKRPQKDAPPVAKDCPGLHDEHSDQGNPLPALHVGDLKRR